MESNLGVECPRLVKKLEELLSDNSDLTQDPEALVYALAQVIQTKLEKSELAPEEKGATISNLNSAFKELFKEDIALYHERLRYLVEQKNSTLH